MPDYTFQYAVTLVDTKALKTTLRWRRVITDVSVVAAFTTATSEADDLLTDLKAVTDASVYRASLAFLDEQGEALPADADITDEALINVWLSTVAQVPKYGQLRIPAPSIAFESDLITVDETDANLIAYVANFGTDKWEISDGEVVVTARENGIVNGYWRSKAKSTNPN